MQPQRKAVDAGQAMPSTDLRQTQTGLQGSGTKVLGNLLAGKNLSVLCLDVRGYWKTGIETREGTTRRAVSAEEHHSHHGGCMEMLQSRGLGDCGQLHLEICAQGCA